MDMVPLSYGQDKRTRKRDSPFCGIFGSQLGAYTWHNIDARNLRIRAE